MTVHAELIGVKVGFSGSYTAASAVLTYNTNGWFELPSQKGRL
ncbi:hypothetical protein [Methyloglobulus sp.]